MVSVDDDDDREWAVEEGVPSRSVVVSSGRLIVRSTRYANRQYPLLGDSKALHLLR